MSATNSNLETPTPTPAPTPGIIASAQGTPITPNYTYNNQLSQASGLADGTYSYANGANGSYIMGTPTQPTLTTQQGDSMWSSMLGSEYDNWLANADKSQFVQPSMPTLYKDAAPTANINPAFSYGLDGTSVGDYMHEMGWAAPEYQAPGTDAAPAQSGPSVVYQGYGGIVNSAMPTTGGQGNAPMSADLPSGGGQMSTQPVSSGNATNDVTNWYRNVLGRDPDAAGLAFWSNLYQTQGPQAAFAAMMQSANTVQPGSYGGMSLADASKNYSGNLSSNGTSVVDEWARNVLGRPATAAEIAQYSGGDVQQQYAKFLAANGSPANAPGWFEASKLGANSPQTTPGPKPPIASGGGAANGDNMTAGTPGVGGGYAPWNVTPEQTVESRIQSIINPSNPIIAAARAGAVDQMNARGLTNSSLATSAADAAAYQAAIPIAQADAATFAKAAGYNADIQNQMAMQQRQLSNSMGIAQLQSDTQKQIAQLNADTQRYTANLDAQTRTTLQGMQDSNQLLIQTNSQAATIFNQAVAAISQIQNNDKMDANSKTQAIANIMQNVNAQLSSMSKSSGVDVSLSLANYPGFDAQGNYVGFNPDGSTKGTAPAPAPPSSSNPFPNTTVNTGGDGAGSGGSAL